MMIPGIMAQRRAAPAGGTLWTPLNMVTVPQIYLDAQDSVVTDVSGACSAISNLGAMGSSGNFSQATAGSRPAILAAELNGKRVLSFDGVNDALLGGSVAQKGLFRNKNAAWAFSIHKKRATDAASELRYIFNASTASAASVRFNAVHGAGAGQINKPAIRVRRQDADSFASLISSSAFSAAYTMVMYQVNYADGAGSVEVDGAVVATNAALTSTGSTSDTASAASLSIGANDAGVAAADIDLAAIVVSDTAPSAADIDKLFGWAAHKYGLTASLPGGHPYKTVAPTV